jgi:hypothetical protein
MLHKRANPSLNDFHAFGMKAPISEEITGNLKEEREEFLIFDWGILNRR